MARFSVSGDEDDEQDPSPSSRRPLPKKRRIVLSFTMRRSAASTSNSTVAPADDDQLLYTSGSGEESEEGEVTPSYRMSPPSWPSPLNSLPPSPPYMPSPLEEEQGYGFLPSSGEEEQVEEDEVQPAIAPVNGNSTPIGTGVTLTDPDLLDCPICLEPLSSPVYQCENGHLACESCCTKIRNKCPSCCFPIGYNRCRAVEKILDSAKISCPNIAHGCMERISYSKKLDHENICKYVPCSCPLSSCDYAGISKSLYTHFSTHHKGSRRLFSYGSTILITTTTKNERNHFFQEMDENTLFVLIRRIESRGELFDVVCVAPASAEENFSYDLNVNVEDSFFNLKTVMDCSPGRIADEHPMKKYLFVPSYFSDSNDIYNLQLVISKLPC